MRVKAHNLGHTCMPAMIAALLIDSWSECLNMTISRLNTVNNLQRIMQLGLLTLQTKWCQTVVIFELARTLTSYLLERHSQKYEVNKAQWSGRACWIKIKKTVE